VRVSRDAPPAVWRGDPGPVFFLQASYPPLFETLRAFNLGRGGVA